MAPLSEKKIGMCNASKKRLETLTQVITKMRQIPSILFNNLTNTMKEYETSKCSPTINELIQGETEMFENDMKICLDLPYSQTILQCIQDASNQYPFHNLGVIMDDIARSEAQAKNIGKMFGALQPQQTEETDQPKRKSSQGENPPDIYM